MINPYPTSTRVLWTLKSDIITLYCYRLLRCWFSKCFGYVCYIWLFVHGIIGWTGSMLWCVQCSWGLVVRWVLAGRELIHSSPSPPPPPSLLSNSTLTTLLASECPLDHRFHMVAVGQRRGCNRQRDSKIKAREEKVQRDRVRSIPYSNCSQSI